MNGAAPMVYVVDDDAAVRDSLAQLFELEGITARAFASARDFLAFAPENASGCLVTDVRMPAMSGLELLARVRQIAPAMPVVVVTAFGDVPMAVEAMKMGAIDFLEKPYSDTDLLAAVHAALQLAGSAEARAARKREMLRRFETLTLAERRVFAGLLQGRLNKTAAFEMGVSLRTVEALRASVMAKLDAEFLGDLVRAAMLVGMDNVISGEPAGQVGTGQDPSAPR